MDSCQFKFIFSSIANQVRPNCHRFFKDAGYAASFNFEIASVTDPAIGGDTMMIENGDSASGDGATCMSGRILSVSTAAAGRRYR